MHKPYNGRLRVVCAINGDVIQKRLHGDKLTLAKALSLLARLYETLVKDAATLLPSNASAQLITSYIKCILQQQLNLKTRNIITDAPK